MERFLGYWSPQELQNRPPPTTEQSKPTLVFLKKKEEEQKTRRKGTLPREVKDTMTVFAFESYLE